MREIVFFRTESYGGTEGRTIIITNFETEEMARENAMKNTYNNSFTLYKVTMIFEGTISEKVECLGRIPCGRDIKAIEREQEYIEKMLEKIEEQKNNKRIKETTREKRIKDIEQRIEWSKQNIRYYEKIVG